MNLLEDLKGLKIYFDIDKEHSFQKFKWGEQNHSAEHWLAILSEEVGEVAKEILEKRPEEYRQELIQVGATVISMLESFEKNGLEGKK